MTLLEIRGLTKTFPGVTALAGVGLAIDAGEVHAVVGANGAGKSTLMHVLAGVTAPTAGEIRLDGVPVAFGSPRAAREHGISIVYQESSAIPGLTVAETVFLGHEPSGRFGVLDRRRMLADAGRLLARYHLALEPGATVGSLSVAGQQLVEIARALSVASRILIFDEPTAMLSLAEQRNLFDIIAALRTPDRAILYVSHRLEEIFSIADRISVLRDGRKVATLRTADVRQADLVRLMVGHEVAATATTPAPAVAAPRLEVEARGGLRLTVGPGEILGLAGLVGSGRSRLARAVAGLEPVTLRVDGRPVRITSPRAALRAGIVYLTEDRKREGVFGELSVLRNTTAAALPRLSRLGFLRPSAERAACRSILERLRLVARSLGAPARQLSGGNQQKVILGRALLAEPRVLVCDEPTRGIDVGAREEIYARLGELARQGVSIILIASDLAELLALSHRVLVLRDGRIVGELPGGAAREHDVLMLATGAAEASR
jgi:ribose transport system ATP-binding protein